MKINITDRAKSFFTQALADFKATAKRTEIDLDLDITPEGHVKAVINNLGGSAKLPMGGMLVSALHAVDVGKLEPGDTSTP